MQKYFRLLLTTSLSLLCIGSAYSGKPNATFLGPTARLSFASPFTDNTAFSLLGEVGVKNFRVGGTAGWRIDDNSRIKLSGDYLWQKITYNLTGHSEQWVQQGELGAGYQYNYADVRLKPAIDLNAYLSHARSKSLSSVTGIVFSGGLPHPFTEMRGIAGSHARGISPGISIAPWTGARIGAALNYDQIRYDTRDIHDVTASGVGGTISASQTFHDDITLDLSASDRKIFNNYEGSLTWSDIQFHGNWAFGVFGDYTTGKRRLPSTYDAGLSADYFIEKPVCPPANLKGEAPIAAPADNFVAWTADPAVHMPQVLAIAELY